MIRHPMLESTWMARSGRESCTCLSCETRAPKRSLLPGPSFESGELIIDAADPALTPQVPDGQTSLLTKKYVKNACCTVRDPRGIFNTHTDDVCASSLVGPLGSPSSSLPMIEFALAKLEGSSTGTPTLPILGSAPSPTQHEVLQKIFKVLLNTKDRAVSPGTSAESPGATAASTGKPAATEPRTLSSSAGSGGLSESGGSQTNPDAGSGYDARPELALVTRVSIRLVNSGACYN